MVEDGEACEREVVISHRSETLAEVRSGLEAGDRVVVYPSDKITSGTSIVPRPRPVTATLL